MAHGAYGWQVLGLAESRWLVPAPGDWPEMTIRQAPMAAADSLSAAEGQSLLVRFGARAAGFVVPSPAAGVAFSSRPLSHDLLVHPHITLFASVLAAWQGKPVLHGGAFASDGGAWAVIGDNGAGKSFALASLAQRGLSVIADDRLVVSEGCVSIGPRCIDLRPTSAAHLGVASTAKRVVTRYRLALGPAPLRSPLRGFIVLRWGRLRIRRLGPRERLAALGANAFPSESTGIRSLLELAQLPGWELRRPRQFASADATSDALMDVVALDA